MTKTPGYDAAWVPGLEHGIDRDESLAVGLRWLADVERQHGGAGIVVMFAKSMIQNAPLLAQAAGRWEFVSPRSSRPRGQGPVLAVWPPDDRTLEFAETLAVGTALCVIPGSLFDISPWIRRSGAPCLVAGFEAGEAANLPEDVTRSLDSMLFFGGHNGFVGGGEKEDAISRLRDIATRPDAPSREDIEEYLRASGSTHAKGVERVGKWYSDILEGRRHRDYRGRVID